MGSITSSVALGIFQALFFAKEPLVPLEKTTPEAVISPCPQLTPGLWVHQEVSTQLHTPNDPFVVTNVPKTCDTAQSFVPGTHSLTDHGFCSH